MVWRRLLQYPPQTMFYVLAGVCVVGALVVGGIAWRTLDRLDRVGDQVAYGVELQQAEAMLQHVIAERRAGARPADPVALAELRRALAALAERGDAEAAPFDRLDALLAAPSGPALEEAGALLDELVRTELASRHALLGQLRADARAEIETATALFLALALLGLGGGWLVRRRILRPLGDLRTMFLKLGAGDFRPVAVEGVHPVLTPLFENYNHLVLRLEELERAHRSRAAHLEGEVRTATEALLDQQRSLARAERLAAVGETAAGLAHELRNPLAGVQMSLSNLRRDLDDPQLAARLELAIAELQRLVRLLNHQLSAARHVPEPSRPLRLRGLVEELLALLRYQVPPHVGLEARVEEDFECRLPRDRLRQALLNLVLNSVQALGARPGRVRLEARCEDGRAILTVTDDGPGFPPELVKGGGQAFVTRREGGTGLGLAMVRRLALDLGGELALENLDPRGARVRLVLPCEDDA